MIYLTIAFFIFSVFFTYKNLNHCSTRFLYGIMLGWVLSIFSLAVFIYTHNYYQYILYKFFSINLDMLSFIKLKKNTIIQMLTASIVTFYYCLLCFSIAFTSRKKHRNKILYILLAIMPIIQYLFYDPYIYTLLYNFYEHTLSLNKFNKFVKFMQFFFKYANLTYLLSAFFILIYYYINYPNIKFLKKYTLYNILCLLPIGILYFLMFSWAPQILIKPTFIKGYYNYLLPDLDRYILFYNIFPYIILTAFVFIIFVIYKYNSIEMYYKRHDLHITRSLDVAYLGVRTFTHSIKNHILAIQSETQYLKDKFKNDKEIKYSLDLILSSCTKSFDCINQASNKLKRFELDLQPKKLNIPVKKALIRAFPLSSDVNFCEHFTKEMPYAYIDEYYMTEAIYNIIHNAVEAVWNCSNKKIDIFIETKNNWGIIKITDNGTGIPSENLEKIFTPFFTTKASVNNWGIGLSYCHKIISAHDGNIYVENNSETGTTFKIVLPVI